MTNVQKLKKLRVYSKFMRNMKNSFAGTLVTVHYKQINAIPERILISIAFKWCETTEGYFFWDDIDKKFMAL